jgi:hypothetical protein
MTKLFIKHTILSFFITSTFIASSCTQAGSTSIDINNIYLKNIHTEEIQVIDGNAVTVRVHKPKENCAVTLFMNGIVRTVSFKEGDRRFTQGYVPELATDPKTYSTSLDPNINLYDLVKMEVENAPNCDQIIIAQSQGGLRATAYAQIMDQLGVGDRIKAIIYVGSPVRGWSALAMGVPSLAARLDQEIFTPLAKAKSSIAEIADANLATLINSITDQLGASATDALAKKATNEVLNQMSPTSNWSKQYMGIDANYSAKPINLFENNFITSLISTGKDSLIGVTDNSIYRQVLPSYIKVGFVIGDENNLGALAAGNKKLVDAGCTNYPIPLKMFAPNLPDFCWPNLTAKPLSELVFSASPIIFGGVAILNRGAWTAESAMSAGLRVDSTGAKVSSTNWKIAYYAARTACFWWCDPSWMMDNANREWDKANRLWDEANYHETLAKRKWDAIGNAEASIPWFNSLPSHLAIAYQSYNHDGLIPAYDQYRNIDEFGGQPISNGEYIRIAHATHTGAHNLAQDGSSPDIWGTDREAGWEKPILSNDGIIASWYEENIQSAATLEEQTLWQMARYNIIVNY